VLGNEEGASRQYNAEQAISTSSLNNISSTTYDAGDADITSYANTYSL